VVPYGDHRKLLLTQDITELERIDAMRRDFVANVSHELKTPLTVLSGFLETMRDLPLADDERARYLDIMYQQAGRMQYIVSDLLALAKLEGDARPPQDRVIDIQAILNHLRADLNMLSGGAHRLSFTADETLTVLGAESEIMSALGNLISNAVRYTPAGGQISVSWQAEEACAVFSVHDTGIGIPADHIPRLTERFYRVDGSRSRDTGGTGLGLAIVKHVLQRHEAHLQVSSEEGRGSVFSVKFPAHRTLRQTAPAASEA
jgi:two-component system phosphate regulon sensor histidine kinase PhoR